VSIQTYHGGSALGPDAAAPATPRNVPNRGGAVNPSAEALRSALPGANIRVEVIWGQTTVFVPADRLFEACKFLHDDPSQRYEYLSDVTAVEYRDASRPIEVVWHLRSIAFRRFLRLKVEIVKGAELKVPSVWPIWRGADWLERECYDMFGITFEGHPDLRRILMWEDYREGFPLRKDFPLRGRFSRSEQLKQALSANPEARYSMEELTIAQAYGDVPRDMRERLQSGEKVGE
jgi:NADH-quinone oxidoreductase subunit C